MFTFRFLHIFSFGICIMCVDMVQNVEETKSVCGADCVLRCKAVQKNGVQYRAVRWYKVGESGPAPRLSGLLTHSLPNGTTQWYVGVQREVELLEDSLDILLPNVTSEDSGRYMCLLAAPVGEQNRDGLVQLTVTGCPENQSVDRMEDVYLVILATVVLVAALCTFLISYACLTNTLRQRNKMIHKETFLDAKLKPLEKKDLMLIYTLGPNWSKAATMKHICV